MAATLADNIFKCNFVNENVLISLSTSLNCVPGGPIGCKISVVQVMAWHQTGAKPLPEPMMTLHIDAYMCLPASMS